MSKTTTFENQLLLHLFNNTAISNIGDVSGLPASSVAGNFYVRLYTDAVIVDDDNAGTETTYTGYVALGVAVPRTNAGWTVTADTVANAVPVTFATCTGNPQTIRYFAVWKLNSSANLSERLYWGQLTTDLVVDVNITPQFPINTITISEQ